MKRERFEIIDHGYDHAQYFQGFGTYGSPYENVVTGCGDNAKEAYEDAVEQVYQVLDSAEAEKLHLPKRPRGIRQRDHVPARLARQEDSEFSWYVSIRF